jgi:N-acetylmuramoyl-L-alanine amidase
MEMKARILCTLLFCSILLLALVAVSRAEASREILESAQKKYETLLKLEKRRSSKTMWLEVINAFDRVVKGYPHSEEAPRALFAEGCIWREMFNYSITLGELYRAEEVFKKFIKTYPRHELAVDAKKNIEEIERQKKDSSLISVSTTKPDPNKFPGRDVALKNDGAGPEDTAPRKDISKDTTGEKKNIGKTDADPAPSPVSIKKIRYFTDDTRTRIVVDMDAAVSFEDAALPRDASKGTPPRIYVDLIGASVTSGLYSPLTVKDGLVSRIRWSNTKNGVVRVVLDLEEKADYKIFCLGGPHRLVIDVLRN